MPISDLHHTFQTGVRDILPRTLFAAFLAVSLSACFHMETPTPGKSPVRVDVDWSRCGAATPSGMTILFHNLESGAVTSVIDNNVDYVTTHLAPGHYRATVFNLTENEFDNIRFRGLGADSTAEAYLRETVAPKWLPTLSGNDGYVAGQPEWLAAGSILTADVAAPDSGDIHSGTQTAVTILPRPLTADLHLLLHIDNIGNLRSARGALTGLAAGHMLTAVSPDDNSVTATHIIESDCWKRSPGSPETGTVEADISCFGLPSDHNASPAENHLIFQALLADGKTVKNYRIPVGHLIHRNDDLNAFSLELWLDPPLPPGNDGGGIDVWFDDWDETIDFNTKL